MCLEACKKDYSVLLQHKLRGNARGETPQNGLEASWMQLELGVVRGADKG
jgi:hypothetical protein